MISRILEFPLRQRASVLLGAVALLAAGLWLNEKRCRIADGFTPAQHLMESARVGTVGRFDKPSVVPHCQRVPQLRSRQITFSPPLRSLAAGALLVWVAAQVFCFAHCNFGVGHSDSGEASCHGSAPTSAHHDDGDSSSPAHHESSASAACSTLKSALVGSSAATMVQPDFQLLYTLAPLALDVTAEPTVSYSRQPKARNWVFTPEVCLGPAFRSLAPPILS